MRLTMRPLGALLSLGILATAGGGFASGVSVLWLVGSYEAVALERRSMT